MSRLEDYRSIVGPDTLEELYLLAKHLNGKSILNVNSTAVGGGVAEILNRLVPLLCEMGINARWEVIKGGEVFYAVTKKFHNALHGDPQDVTSKDYQIYEDTVDQNMNGMALDQDIVFVHDPHPAALVKKSRGMKNHWIWRCHIDLSKPDPRVWNFL